LAWDKEDISFKKLLSKLVTDNSKFHYEELGGRVLELDKLDIRQSDIPFDDPDQGITNGICQLYDKYTLTRETSVTDYECYYVNDGGRIGDFISDKHGFKYSCRLFDNTDNEIPITSDIGWLFDYKTGVLIIQQDTGLPKPYKITAYRYIGSYIVPGTSPRNRKVTNISILSTISSGSNINASSPTPEFSVSGDLLNLGTSPNFLTNEIYAYINGLKLVNGDHFNYINSSTFTLSMPVYKNDKIEIQTYI